MEPKTVSEVVARIMNGSSDAEDAGRLRRAATPETIKAALVAVRDESKDDVSRELASAGLRMFEVAG